MTKLKTVWQATQELAFAKFVRAEIEKLTDDEETIRDTLEGELEAGQVDGIMNALLHEYHTACAMAEARRSYAASLTEGARSLEDRADLIKGLIREGMTVAGQDKWKGVLGSVSATQGRLKAVVVDEAVLPVEYYKRALDQAKISEHALKLHAAREAILHDASLTDADRAAALKALPTLIPGVEVERGPDSVTIRKPSSGKKET